MKKKQNLNFWKNKKVFITGHTGFKGSWLCLILSLFGAEVTGYSLKPKTKPSLFKLAKIENVIKKSVISDVRNYKNLFKEIKFSKANIIFHLAAQPLVRYSYTEPKETFETNFLGTLNILECIKKIKSIKSSVIITSDKVYDTKINKIYRETDFLKGIDPYSASKVICEHVFFSYKNSFFENTSKQRIATVRAGNVIGGGDYSKDRLIPDLISHAQKNKKIILRNPNSTRPWQHVLEPLSGYLILAEKLYTNNQKVCAKEQNWNFGPNVTNCKTVKYIANFINKKISLKFHTVKLKNNNYKIETNFLRLSNYKSKKYLSWFPKWNLEKTLTKILEWYALSKNINPREVCKKQIKEYFEL